MEGFCLFSFYLLLNTELCIQRAYRENIDKWLVRLQISAFISMTLQNTLRNTIHICREILTLWYSVMAPGICNVVKQIICWNHKILIWLQTLSECVHREKQVLYISQVIFTFEKKCPRKAQCIKSITIDAGLLIIIMPRRSLLFTQWTVYTHRSLLFTQWTDVRMVAKDLVFQTECSQEAEVSKFLLMKIKIYTSR